MNELKIFENCIKHLAEIYSHEDNEDARETAKFLYSADCQSIKLNEQENSKPLSQIFNSFEVENEHPLVKEVRKISHLLPWYQTDMGGRIDDDLKSQMIMTELVGPHSLLYTEEFELGVFLQLPNVNYPKRRHPAEETFYTLSGKSLWQLEDNEEREKVIGEYVFHPSMAMHANRTTDEHLIACWRWSGDISLENYYKYQ